MIKIVLVANSGVDRGLLQNVLQKEPTFQIINAVGSDLFELETLDFSVHPDVILMIQQTSHPCNSNSITFLQSKFNAPIIISATDTENLPKLKNIYFLPKIDIRPMSEEFKFWVDELIALIKKVSRQKISASTESDAQIRYKLNHFKQGNKTDKKAGIIAIGASTGGPQTLNEFLALLPKNLNVPVVIVQHMPVNFLSVLTNWLQNDCPLPIQIARKGEAPRPGNVYFAPDNYHLIINNKKKFDLVDAPPMHNVKPAVSYLFKSVAEVYGNKALGILFTGMGRDGAKELALIKEKGGVTFAQNKETSIVFGMPKEAIRLNGATYIMSPREIAQKLREFI